MMGKNNITATKRIVSLFFIGCLLSACENGIVGTGDKPTAIKGGYAQKGPFEKGSIVTIVARSGPEFVATDTYNVATLDGIGSFEFTFKTNTLYDISISGRNFNEVSGAMSAAPITLLSTYYHSENSAGFIGVNILTHQIHKRINYLIANGIHPVTASTQASQELKRELGTTIFAEHLDDFNFNRTTVYNLQESDTTANAVLLFISAAFYQQSLMYTNSKPLIEVINFIANDLETDGIIETADAPITGGDLISSFDYAARLLNPEQLIENLTQHGIDTMGQVLSVPNINFLLDNDGDGISNDIDTDDDGDGFADIDDANPYLFDIYLTPQTVTTSKDTAIKLDLQFSKPEESYKNIIFIEIDVAPTNGSMTNNYPNVVYTPNPGFVGTDSFVYHVVYTTSSAKIISSDSATVTIEVTNL